MDINVIPEKMEQGKITSISIKVGEEKEEIYTIPPTPFENFEAMKDIIVKFKGTEELWKKVKQEFELVANKFNLADFKYKELKQEFDLLIDPEKEPVVVVKPPEAIAPPKEPQTAQACVTLSFPPAERVIVPPKNQTDIAKQEVTEMHTRAEQNEQEFQKSTAPIIQEAPLTTLMRERPTLLVSNVQDMLPEKANRVLNDVSERLTAAQELTDLTKPLKKQEPLTASDWVAVIEPTMTERLGNGETEFTQEEMEQLILIQGVPKKLVEKVAQLLVRGWEKDDRFEKDERGILTKAKEFVFGKEKKKKKSDED